MPVTDADAAGEPVGADDEVGSICERRGERGHDQRVTLVGQVARQAAAEGVEADHEIGVAGAGCLIGDGASNIEQAPVNPGDAAEVVHLDIEDRAGLTDEVAHDGQPVGAAQRCGDDATVGQEDSAARHDRAAAGQQRVAGDEQAVANIMRPAERVEHRPIRERHIAKDIADGQRPVADDKGQIIPVGDEAGGAVEQAAVERDEIICRHRQLPHRHRAGAADQEQVAAVAAGTHDESLRCQRRITDTGPVGICASDRADRQGGHVGQARPEFNQQRIGAAGVAQSDRGAARIPE